MLTKLWRKLRQQDRVEELERSRDEYREGYRIFEDKAGDLQDRVEELEELAYSRREIPDRASQGCVVKDSIQITPWRERLAMEVDLHERAKFRVKELERELAEEARETGNEPKIKPITEAEMATMDPPFPPEQIENVLNKIPGKLTTGLVKPVEQAPNLVIKNCVGIPGTVEEAPAEPTLREFLVEFRKWLVGGIPSDLRDWLDARLGKEESDG